MEMRKLSARPQGAADLMVNDRRASQASVGSLGSGICSLSWLIAAALLVAWPARAQQQKQSAVPGSDPSLCYNIADFTARLRCYEAEMSKSLAGTATTAPGTGTWRLVRTPDPAGGRDSIAIMQTANITRSDIDFAGIMIRCGESKLEVVAVLVTPLPPRSRPKVTVKTVQASQDFTGTVLGPGAAILLPAEASAFLSGAWLTAPDLTLRIADDDTVVEGSVPLTGLGTALPQLTASCSSR